MSFIVLEGGEASGKSTQAARLAAAIGATLSREPGGTELGSRLRALLLDPATGAMSSRAEALLMMADRAQHIEQVVTPALAAGRHVVSDRHAGSTLAYQGGGRGLDVDALAEMSRWACGGVRPDLVVLLDLPVETAHARLGGALDRLEGEGGGFHQRVRSTFLSLAESDERWVVVDAAPDPEEVWHAVASAVEDRLGLVVPRGDGG